MEKFIPALWILIAIGTFIYRMIKKAQEATAKDSRERPQPQRRPGPVLDRDAPAAPALPDTSFQELLRQMQTRNVEAPDAEHTPAGRPVPVETVPPVRSKKKKVEAKSLEAPATSRPAKLKARSLEAPATSCPINPPKQVARLGQSLPRAVLTARADATFAEYTTTETRHSDTSRVVRRLLHRPDNVRAAFVLSEVFQRRY